jgi:phosphoribosylformimino-5-aminoimidazole carboxamide ribotide isomerase
MNLLGGLCVRLRQGRFDEATVYSDDPVAVATSFVEQGAEMLHIVDLDGARSGESKNLEWIYRIRQKVSAPIQLGGGVRSLAVARRLYEAGVDRIVFGTAAAEDPRLLFTVLEHFPTDRLAAAIDIREGRLAIEGWEQESSKELGEVLDNMSTLGVRWVVCTDVNRDGLLVGPSYDLAGEIIRKGFLVVIAGGVATLDDIAKVRGMGAAGCIVGSALYGGMLTLPDAIKAAGAY